jgi:hypothetical protein
MLVGNYESRKAAKQQRASYNSAQVDRFANVMTSVAQRELVMGRVRKGGAVYFRGTSGYYRERFMAHLALAGHEIDAVEQVYLNDELVSLDPDGYVTTAPYNQTRKVSGQVTLTEGATGTTLPQAPIDGTVSVAAPLQYDGDGSPIPGRWLPFTRAGSTITLGSPVATGESAVVAYQYIENTPYVRVRWELGSPNAVADARTREIFPDLWTENHRAQGVAKLIAEFVYNDSVFTNGIPALSAVIRGARIYDPRSGLTQWSENPALMQRHVYTHPFFGKASVNAAEEARIIAAANACDTSQPYTLPGGVVDTEPLYQAALVAQYGTPAKSLLDDLAQAMAGLWGIFGGELHIRAGVYTAPVMTLTDADLAVVQRKGDQEEQDQITISPHRERNDKFNVVNPRIWDRGQSFKDVALTPVRSAALITADLQELAIDVPMPAIFFAPQAQHVAGVMMRDARDPLVFDAPFKMTAYPLEPFDTVAVTLDRYGWVAKTFMILERVWDRQRGVVRLAMKETSAAIYTPDAVFLAQGYALNTALPNPWDIEPPAISIASGTSELLIAADGTVLTRVRVSWLPITDTRVTFGGQVEVQWLAVGSDQWHSILVDGSSSDLYIYGVSDGMIILVRARARTQMAASDWCAQQLHIVVGKTAPPSNVASFAVDQDGIATWATVPDADVRSGGGYRLRWQPGNNRSWGDASPLHDGLIGESPYPIRVRPVGTATIMVKAVDSSGNESPTATACVVNLGNPIVENVVTTTDYQAAGFPGTALNASLIGGNLVADADPSPLAWDPNENTSGWTLDTDPGWTVITYKAITYTPSVLIVAAGDDGEQLTLQQAVTATAFLISYRRDGDALAWTADGEPGWTDDAGPGWTTEAYRPWPGTVTVREGRYEFQITTQSRDVQSVISQLVAQIDVPDVVENVGQVSVSSLGNTVVPVTKTFRVVTGIGLTLVGDGGTAVNARVESLETRTITTRDAANAAVNGTVIATVQGY